MTPIKDSSAVNIGDKLYLCYSPGNTNNRRLGEVRSFVDNRTYVLLSGNRYHCYSLKIMQHHIKQGYLMRVD